MRDKIEIVRDTTHLAPDVVGQRVGAIITNLQSELRLHTEWIEETNTIRFNSCEGFANGVKGTLEIGATRLALVVNLPILLRPQADYVESEITKVFDEALQ